MYQRNISICFIEIHHLAPTPQFQIYFFFTVTFLVCNLYTSRFGAASC